MGLNISGLTCFHHAGLVVRNLEAAMESCHTMFGASFSEFEVNEGNSSFTGTSKSFSLRFGIGLAGLTFIELIQPASGTSIYSAWLDQHGPGLHHLAFAVGDIAAVRKEIELQGYPWLLNGSIHGLAELSYYQAPDLGCVVEPIQFSIDLPAFLLENAKPYFGSPSSTR